MNPNTVDFNKSQSMYNMYPQGHNHMQMMNNQMQSPIQNMMNPNPMMNMNPYQQSPNMMNPQMMQPHQHMNMMNPQMQVPLQNPHMQAHSGISQYFEHKNVKIPYNISLGGYNSSMQSMIVQDNQQEPQNHKAFTPAGTSKIQFDYPNDKKIILFETK